ncbi:MAG: hypothetical protein D3903_07900, partial [Candidatus Electrothrix sp. GM3_4]|nr:hypothetical protein [Candidatus Electrothrix sp. GM3_4]
MPPAIDEFEDLTQFADESFDNDEVDLFEFTDDDESPLLRLKSIVLSLDWDITEDTLAELTEELSDLRSLWDGDKVAQVYLQGMDNIGKYLQKEGAYAHPNAIKLLLTLFYNYEKIISSTDLSSEAVAVMLKADVRKFKVLQYQIGTTGVEGHAEKHAEEHVEEHVEAAPPPPEEITQGDTEIPSVSRQETDDPLTSMEATILGLEWEVTQEGLEKFHSEATELREHLTENRDAQILVQGLQALGSYIREEKSNAHPDSFTILHAFYDALKLLIQDTNLTAEQRKQVLIEQIASLNSLKAIIAKSATEQAVDKSAGEKKIGTEATEATKTPEVRAPEQEPEPEDEPEYEDEFDSPVADDDEDLDLFSEDFDENSEFSAGGDGVDEFFLDEDDSLSDEGLGGEESIAGDFEFDEEEGGFDFEVEGGLDDDLFAEEAEEEEQKLALDDDANEEESILPALTDTDEDGGFNEDIVASGIDNEKAAELDEKLDSFFDFDDLDETTEPEEEKVVAVEESESIAEENDSELGESDEELDSFFDFSDDVADDESLKKEEKADAESWKDEILSANFDGPDGEEEGLLEGEEAYDSFFDFDSDEDEDKILQNEQAVATDNDDTLVASDDDFKISPDGLDDEQESEEITVALADANADEERGFNEDEMSSGIADEKAAELDEKLNFFFELDKEEQEESSGDQILGAEEEDAVTTEVFAESVSSDEEQGELSLELDEDSSGLSFNDEEDFEGDIAVFSDIDDTEAVSIAAGHGDESASDSEEEIEGLDALFDFGDDGEGAAPEFDSSNAVGQEEIPALEDEFVVSLDEKEDDADELFDFSFDSDDEKEGAVASESSETLDSADSFFGLDEDADSEVKTAEVADASDSEDELFDFSFDSDEDEKGAVASETTEELDSANSFFGLDEDADGEVKTAEVADASDSEGELFDFSFDSDDEKEGAIAFDSSEELDSADSFFGLDEESDSEVAEVADAGETNDKFSLSLDDEETSDDELAEFSFDSDDEKEGAIAFDSSESLDSADSFFGLDEESEGGVEVAEVADAGEADDEFALWLDDENTGDDELAEFSFDSDDEKEGAIAFD